MSSTAVASSSRPAYLRKPLSWVRCVSFMSVYSNGGSAVTGSSSTYVSPQAATVRAICRRMPFGSSCSKRSSGLKMRLLQLVFDTSTRP